VTPDDRAGLVLLFVLLGVTAGITAYVLFTFIGAVTG